MKVIASLGLKVAGIEQELTRDGEPDALKDASPVREGLH